MEGNENPNNNSQARLGVVQTAYANGASTDYLKKLGLEVNFTPTGVIHLDEKAALFDIGIYFEANGHGTILFSESWLSWLEARNNELSLVSEGSEQQKAALRLLSVSKLINQAVGDALSSLLLVEAILQHKGWSIHKWNELYQDLPSRQLKIFMHASHDVSWRDGCHLIYNIHRRILADFCLRRSLHNILPVNSAKMV